MSATPRPAAMLLLFGLVNLPLSMLMSPTAAVLPNYYLDYGGVTLAGLATATLVARLFDGITDPLIGWLSDRSGSRKPWMVAGALVVAGGAWFLYNPGPSAGLGHLLGWYLVVTLGWTLVEIPHTAMGAGMATDYDERSRIALWRQMLGFVGGLLFMASPLLLAGGGTSFTPEVMSIVALFVMLALPLTVGLLCWRVPEPALRAPPRRLAPADLFRALRDTPPLRYFLATQVLFGLATGAVSALFVIYLSRYLGMPGKVPHVALPMTLAMAAGMPIWLRVMRRVDKHRAWAMAGIGMIACLLAILAVAPGPGSVGPFTALMTAFGFFLGLSSIALPSLLADIMDYDLWRNRQERAAIFFSFQAVVTKLNQGFGAGIALAIPAAFGFSGEAAVDGRGALALKTAFIAWPCLLLGAMSWLAWRYPLGRKAHAALARRLSRRAGGATHPPVAA